MRAHMYPKAYINRDQRIGRPTSSLDYFVACPRHPRRDGWLSRSHDWSANRVHHRSSKWLGDQVSERADKSQLRYELVLLIVIKWHSKQEGASRKRKKVIRWIGMRLNPRNDTRQNLRLQLKLNINLHCESSRGERTRSDRLEQQHKVRGSMVVRIG